MIVTWTVEGVDWSQDIEADINTEPAEIATKGVELIINSLEDSDKEISFGAVLKLFHNKMKSEDEHIFIFAPHILANAGFYDDAEQLKDLAHKELMKDCE